jgi:2-hydroxy-6-oxonona-2,4-dienedioate hydrolase
VKLAGRPRLLPGEGFAARPGLWRLALRTACERRARPVAVAVRGGPALQSVWLQTRHGRVHARVSAQVAAGEVPLVLIHGVCVSGRYLLPTAAELAADRRVIVPDLPGYGLSDGSPESPALAALADAAADCARAAGHDRVALAGNSFGAQIAVEAALRHPDSVERLVLLAPTVDPQARGLLRQGLRWLRNVPDDHVSVFAIMARDLADMGPRRAARALRVMLDDAIEDKLPDVRCPTLVVRPGRDRVVPDGWARRAAALLPHGGLLVVPGYGHMAHYSGAPVIAQALRPFLDGGAPPGRPRPR